MAIEQIRINNKYENFNYLIACPEEKVAMVVDPLDHQMCLDAAEENGWRITHAINTHEHFDHVGGNEAIVAATGATLYAYENLVGTVPDIKEPVKSGDVIKLGETVEVEALYTPGHTMGHICLFVDDGTRSVLTGDTVFNAGVGNCRNGGDVAALYETITKKLGALDDDWIVYPGHDYLDKNIQFTLDREPDNEVARKVFTDNCGESKNEAFVSTMGLEKQINVFFRLGEPGVINKLREDFPELSDTPGENEVFLKLRELRDAW